MILSIAIWIGAGAMAGVASLVAYMLLTEDKALEGY